MSVGVKKQWFQPGKASQKLLENLINDAVKVVGENIYYVARGYANFDPIYMTDDQSTYNTAWMLAVYVKNVLGFTGDREFLSKFAGLEIRDQIVVSIPMYSFDQVIAQDALFPPLPNKLAGPANRPREGDIVFFFENGINKCFQIKYVNLTDMFFPLGKVYTWECTCELFEYSSETFNTGIPEIDRIQIRGNLNVLSYLLTDLDGVTPLLLDPYGDYWVVDSYNFAAIDPVAVNQQINTEANNYIDFSEIDPTTDANNQGSTI